MKAAWLREAPIGKVKPGLGIAFGQGFVSQRKLLIVKYVFRDIQNVFEVIREELNLDGAIGNRKSLPIVRSEGQKAHVKEGG